jgi:hypothetical protein
VSRAFIRRYFDGRDPIGQRFRELRAKEQSGWLTIVGVVGDVRRERLDSPAVPEVYLPLSQNPISRL